VGKRRSGTGFFPPTKWRSKKLLRLECLNREIFSDIFFEAREKINNWIEDYNTCRLHSALGYKTPKEIWEKGRE